MVRARRARVNGAVEVISHRSRVSVMSFGRGGGSLPAERRSCLAMERDIGVADSPFGDASDIVRVFVSVPAGRRWLRVLDRGGRSRNECRGDGVHQPGEDQLHERFGRDRHHRQLVPVHGFEGEAEYCIYGVDPAFASSCVTTGGGTWTSTMW